MRDGAAGHPPEQDNGTPFDGLNYQTHVCMDRPPSTAEIGQLAKAIAELTGVSGTLALASAIMIDQGRCAESLAALTKAIERKREAAEVERERAKLRRAQP